MKIRITTYSTVPRGDVVHAVSLAGALADRGHDVEVWALSHDGMPFLSEPRVPVRLIPLETDPNESVEERVERGTRALAAALRVASPVQITHAVDPLTAQALLGLRDEGRLPAVIRTIHHVDAFTDPALLEWQRRSIVDVDVRICVSRHWAERVDADFGVGCHVIPNGLESERFIDCDATRAQAGAVFGWGTRPAVLAVGGIEARKGSRLLLEAFARARGRLGDDAVLAIAGGGALFDGPEYRDAWWRDASRLGVVVHDAADGPAPPQANVIILGVVAEDQMPTLYRAADVLAFPSTREGFGMVVLEAMASGTPAVVADIPVLREHLTDDVDCVMVSAGDSGPLSNALVSVARDEQLRRRLVRAGAETAARFTWSASADAHEQLYARVLRDFGEPVPVR